MALGINPLPILEESDPARMLAWRASLEVAEEQQAQILKDHAEMTANEVIKRIK